MDIRRIISYMALALVSLSLWNAWQIDYPPKQTPVQNPITQQNAGEPLLPQVDSTSNSAGANPLNPSVTSTGTQSAAPLVEVKTDVLNVAIDLQQGDIVSSQLLNYPLSVEDVMWLTAIFLFLLGKQ
jgi:YidC/Oxa1 family membrane protein insertase